MREMLDEKLARFEALERQMVDPDILADSQKMAAVAREHGSLAKLATTYRRFRSINEEIAETNSMMSGDDPEMAELAEAELPGLREHREKAWNDLLDQTIGGEDANRDRCVMEIRAGTGGDEAALFAGDLFGMYKKYSETKGWKVEVLDSSATELGGFKELHLAFAGEGVFRELQYESGGHRVQRVPETETKGRIHTSAATVAVLPEPEDVEIDLKQDDYRIDKFHASGPGGPTRQQDRIGNSLDALRNRNCRFLPRRQEPAQKLGSGITRSQDAPLRTETRGGARQAGRSTQDLGWVRRPEPADPHVQFPGEPTDRSPHQPHPLQTRQHHRRESGPCHRSVDRSRSAAVARLHGSGITPSTAMTDNETWTVLRLLQWTESFLREHRSETPRLDAEILLAAARGCRRIDLYTAFDMPATDQERDTFRGWVRQRAEGAPVAYLVGSREFYSRPFVVTPDVLIPRPETEFVILELLDRAQPQDHAWRIADVGTGSGILAITAALELPAAHVWGFDISAAALEVAKDNASRLDVTERVHLCEADLFGEHPETPPFDFILSNPPYVSEQEYDALDRGVRDYEPKVALVAGPHGTSIIERLMNAAAARLLSGGWLIMEISPMIADRVQRLIQQHGGYAQTSIRKDLSQHARVVSAQRA